MQSACDFLPNLLLLGKRLADSRLWRASVIAVLLTSGCTGYQIGANSLYRSDIQTVNVSIAESDSLRPFLGERLTEAIIREIQTQTPYRISNATTAQSTLTVRLVNDTKRVVGENVNDEPRDLQVGMRADVTWTNQLGQTLVSRPVLVVEELDNLIPEGGQSMVTTQQDVIDKLARRIVAQMESDW